MTNLLDVRNLTIAFGDAPPVVEGVSFSAAPGEIVALVGESGSGKTLASKSLLGLLPPGARIVGGEAMFEGVDLAGLDEETARTIRGRRIGMIFQEPMTSLDPSMTIGRQMAEALLHHRDITPEEARRLSIEMLQRIRIPDPLSVLDRYPHQFSGGMRQRIMIASVMLLRPALVLADEPTTALDVLVQKEVLELLVELARDAGSGVILITHDLGLVAEYADRIVVMRHGRIVEAGTCAETLAGPKEQYTRDLLSALPSRANRLGLVSSDRAGERLIEAKDVHVVYHGNRKVPWKPAPVVRPLSGVDLEVRRGETVAVVGESGSGKTTLARALLRLVPVTSGRILFDGADVTRLSKAALRDVRRRIRIVFQDPYSALDPRLRVGAIVAEGLKHEKGFSAGEIDRRVRAALDEVALGGAYADRFPHQLSGGQRQRVNIARAIISNPDLIIADEPVSALDVTVQAEILKLLERLQAARGFGCIFISHSLAVVEQVADRAAVIYRGKFVEIGSRDDIFDRPRHPYTCALLKAAPRLERRADGSYALAPYAGEPTPPPEGRQYSHWGEGGGDVHQLIEVVPGHFVACSPSSSSKELSR